MIKLWEFAAVRKAFRRRFCKKHPHASRGAAQSQLRQILKRSDAPGARDSAGLTVYECATCLPGTWHVGHLKPQEGSK